MFSPGWGLTYRYVCVCFLDTCLEVNLAFGLIPSVRCFVSRTELTISASTLPLSTHRDTHKALEVLDLGTGDGRASAVKMFRMYLLCAYFIMWSSYSFSYGALRRNNDWKSMTFILVSQDRKSGRRVFGDRDEDRVTGFWLCVLLVPWWACWREIDSGGEFERRPWPLSVLNPSKFCLF